MTPDPGTHAELIAELDAYITTDKVRERWGDDALTIRVRNALEEADRQLADANREASFNHEAATRYAEELAAAEGALKQATDALEKISRGDL